MKRIKAHNVGFMNEAWGGEGAYQPPPKEDKYPNENIIKNAENAFGKIMSNVYVALKNDALNKESAEVYISEIIKLLNDVSFEEF